MNPGMPTELPDILERNDTGSQGSTPFGEKRLRLAAKIALFLGILVFLNYAVGWLANLVAFQMWPRHMHAASFLLLATVVSYMLLLAIPFLPGIEVGLMLMAMLGHKGIILVYLCRDQPVPQFSVRESPSAPLSRPCPGVVPPQPGPGTGHIS